MIFEDVKVGKILRYGQRSVVVRGKDIDDSAVRVEYTHPEIGDAPIWIYAESLEDVKPESSESGIPLEERSNTYQDMGIDIITFCKANLDNFDGFEGAMMLPITKYVWRQKDNRVEDLMKARDFLDVLIEYEKGKHGEILESE